VLLIVFLFVLGINKQLDFQLLLREVGRYLARSKGWFREPRVAQAAFAYAVFAVAAVFGLALLAATLGLWHSNALALLGAWVLVVFLVIRTASIHHIRIPLDYHGGNSFKITDMIELIGVVCILLGSLMYRADRTG
jgi:hypothetical protein